MNLKHYINSIGTPEIEMMADAVTQSCLSASLLKEHIFSSVNKFPMDSGQGFVMTTPVLSLFCL